MTLAVTAIYASLLTLLYIALTARVITYRRENRLSLGDQGDTVLQKRMRAHGNFAEYAPLGVLLLALVEAQGTPGFAVHLLGLMLLVGRLAHATYFILSTQEMRLRVIGMVLTLTMLLVSALGLLAHAIWPG